MTSGPLPSRGNRTLYVNVDSPRAESRYKGTEREPLLSGNSEESPLTSRGASPDLSDAASPVGLGYPGLPAHAYSEAGHIYHSYLLKRTLSVPHNLAQYR